MMSEPENHELKSALHRCRGSKQALVASSPPELSVAPRPRRHSLKMGKKRKRGREVGKI